MVYRENIRSREELGYKKYSEDWLIANYLKYGSVDAVFSRCQERPPYSPAEFHRIIRRRGIVKGDGRGNKSFAQALYVFMNRALSPHLSLEKIYRTLPPSMRDATMTTMYRIYDSILKGETRRLAVGVVLTSEDDDNKILLADELETKLSSGKRRGDSTIPFGFASRKLTFPQSVLRILQREFSTQMAISGDLALDGALANEILPSNLQPFLEMHILDIKFLVCHVRLPFQFCGLSACSSYTVANHRFERLSDSLNGRVNLRTGIGEVLEYYRTYLGNTANIPLFQTSQINLAILQNYR